MTAALGWDVMRFLYIERAPFQHQLPPGAEPPAPSCSWQIPNPPWIPVRCVSETAPGQSGLKKSGANGSNTDFSFFLSTQPPVDSKHSWTSQRLMQVLQTPQTLFWSPLNPLQRLPNPFSFLAPWYQISFSTTSKSQRPRCSFSFHVSGGKSPDYALRS